MKYLALICACCVVMSSRSAEAGFVCSGILTDAQQQGFGAFFAPAYSPALRHQGGSVSPANMSKEVTEAERAAIEKPSPRIAKQLKLSASQAQILKGWLNANASASVPSWISTAIGALVPSAWIGIAADVFLQLLNGSGDAGRQTAANLAGTVTAGGIVGVTERIATDAGGKRKFLWAYQYQATINGNTIVAPLAGCSADVVVK